MQKNDSPSECESQSKMGVDANQAVPPRRFDISPAQRRYMLGLLVVVGVIGWVDRNVLAVLLESIKHDLHLSDSELGLLGGLAFGLFYATLGIPVAWLADHGNRGRLIALALGLWSVMTALCGTATGFVSLFLARVGVGVGEAGGTPPSQSLISDYYPPERRASALGILCLYIPLGLLVGYVTGGWFNEWFGWRITFLLIAIPGILVALAVRFTLREPPRGYADGIAQRGRSCQPPPIAASVRYFLSRHSLRHLPVAGAVYGIGAFASAVWIPSYLIRFFGFDSGVAGTWMALAYGGGGCLGVLIGGHLADGVATKTGDPRWHAWIAAGAVLASVPLTVLVYVTGSPAIAFVALFTATALGHVFLGPVMALVQGLAGIRRRAVAAALNLLLSNLVAAGVGPLAVGIASDWLTPYWGPQSLRIALPVVAATSGLWAALHFLLSARTLRKDLAYARLEDAARGGKDAEAVTP